MYACENDTVTFAWQYLTAPGDTIVNTQWTFAGQSHEAVATGFNGQLYPSAAFGHRVNATGNAGITLQHVVSGDSGNFSVQVNGYNSSGIHFELTTSVTLLVSGKSW
jgi:hypothetical protein